MKQLLVDAICGAGFGSMKEADYYTKLGLAKFTGNLHNEKWDWDVDSLNALSEETLSELYSSIKKCNENSQLNETITKEIKPLSSIERILLSLPPPSEVINHRPRSGWDDTEFILADIIKCMNSATWLKNNSFCEDGVFAITYVMPLGDVLYIHEDVVTALKSVGWSRVHLSYDQKFLVIYA